MPCWCVLGGPASSIALLSVLIYYPADVNILSYDDANTETIFWIKAHSHGAKVTII